ncbi:hypothetical protein [Nocardioides alkalitolerans]|uniref:hypothetical protein n=1 Tax=Nocardioides alkalitolerans TaxID=281714 RepID=UPI00048EBA96|nr:hypothetical protein [Nocardioides alkalitolerans]
MTALVAALSIATAIQAHAGWITAVGAAVIMLAGLFVWIKKKVREPIQNFNRGLVALVGREAVIDPATGMSLAPPIPGLGVRLAHIEEVMSQLAVNDQRTTQVFAQMETIHGRLNTLQEQIVNHMTDSESERQSRLAEQTAMWRAIEAVAGAPATPPLAAP